MVFAGGMRLRSIPNEFTFLFDLYHILSLLYCSVCLQTRQTIKQGPG